MYTPAFPAGWPRQEQQRNRKELPSGYSVTTRLDVSGFRRAVKIAGLPFHDAFVWCVSQILTKVPELRIGMDGAGTPGCYDVLHPVYTLYHEDDHTFSDLWTYHDPDLVEYCRQAARDREKYGDNRGPQARGGLPHGFYYISWMPGMDVSAHSTDLTGGRQSNLFPVVTFGTETWREGRWELPFSVNVACATAGGWYVTQFVEMLQEGLGAIDYPPVPGEEEESQ